MKRTTPQEPHGFNPPVCVTDDDRNVHISIGLPGVKEEQIRIDLEKTSLTVSILTGRKMLRKIIHIPKGARFFQKKLSDGRLEIILEKPVP
jgi:HSP20 family molecular chaperone IbpA